MLQAEPVLLVCQPALASRHARSTSHTVVNAHIVYNRYDEWKERIIRGEFDDGGNLFGLDNPGSIRV
jgi:hypothetical protein